MIVMFGSFISSVLFFRCVEVDPPEDRSFLPSPTVEVVVLWRFFIYCKWSFVFLSSPRFFTLFLDIAQEHYC